MAKLCIQEVAQAKEITQSRLQLLAQVTPPLLNRYWNNKIRTVDLVALEKIARALDVAPGELIVEGEPASKRAKGDKWSRPETSASASPLGLAGEAVECYDAPHPEQEALAQH